jgi:hypothetical protein
MKAQGSLEYLIIIAAVLAIAAVTVTFMSGVFGTSSKSANIALCRQAAASCDNKLATGVSKSCPECEESCINPITRRDVIGGTIECGVGCLFCKQGKVFDVTGQSTTSTYNMLYGGYSPITGHEQSGYAVSIDGIHWLKASKDPILPLGPEEFDNDHASCIHPVKISDNLYYGYYGACCYNESTRWQVGFATSPNGLIWTKGTPNPVLTVGPPGSWDDNESTNMFVLKDDTDYKGWYLGRSGTTYAIGYATSPDGITWTKYGGNPIIKLSDIPWATPRIEYPFVIKEGGIYKMWYSAGTPSGKAIGYATSSDGITWTHNPAPILTAGLAGNWDSTGVYHPFIIHRTSNYEMWYAGLGYVASVLYIKIGYATSPDGITWTKYSGNPVLDVGLPGDWDDRYVFCPYGLYE